VRTVEVSELESMIDRGEITDAYTSELSCVRGSRACCECNPAERLYFARTHPPSAQYRPREITPHLHLNQLEGDLAWIGQPMGAADRHIDRFVLVHRAHVAVHGDLGGSAHHDPMLGAMEMLLQRQLGAGFDHDALDLIARAGVDALVVAPWPVDAPMLDGSRRFGS